MKFNLQHWNNLKGKYKIENEPEVVAVLQLILAKAELGITINYLEENWLKGNFNNFRTRVFLDWRFQC